MKYALILESDFDHPSKWICYHLSDSENEIQQLDCYSPGTQELSKNHWVAENLDTKTLNSCMTANPQNFLLVRLTQNI